MIFVIIAFFIIFPLVFTCVAIEWFIKNYTEEEKKDVWENFYKQLENNKDLFK
jgi:hypothetical protein